MRREEILDLLLLDADGGLSPADSARLEEALAGDPTLQIDRESIRSAWRELQSLGRSVAMRREVVDTALAAVSRHLATTSARQPPKNRDSASSPARRQRKPPQERG
jgi:anti-sigma factor RsiW